MALSNFIYVFKIEALFYELNNHIHYNIILNSKGNLIVDIGIKHHSKNHIISR